MPPPGGAHREHRGALPGGQPAHDRGLLGRQVGRVVRLDVADGAVEVGAAAQWAVDDEEIVCVLAAGPERLGELHLGGTQPLLQRE